MAYKKNPFTLSFGRKPNEYIEKENDEIIIYDTFTQLPVTEQVYMITGVRGSGKTVTLTTLTARFRELPDWIVIKISSADDVLDALLKNLLYNEKVHTEQIGVKADISVLNANISVKDKRPQRNVIEEIDSILAKLQKRDLNVLVAIDEVTNTTAIQKFVSAFQLWITNDRPIYLLATALYEQLESLQDVKNLTFLYRAQRVALTPLHLPEIKAEYQQIFDLSDQDAIRMAKITMGYPLAFQTLGYVTWNRRDEGILSDKILNEFDTRMAATAYNKMWSELSGNDREAMIAIATSESNAVKDIREIAGMDTNNFNQYKRRLMAKGLIIAPAYGKASFALPRFQEYIEKDVLADLF